MSFWLQLERSPAGTGRDLEAVMAAIPWSADGLIPAVAQQYDSGEVLMLAWMNPESLRVTLEEGRACYWSRSRRCLWRKGDTSGHVQHLVSATWIATAMRCCCRWTRPARPATPGAARASTTSFPAPGCG